jgi:chromosomal replication initiator protein
MTQQPESETEEPEALEIKADVTVTVGLKDGQGLNATQAWQSVLGQLQVEMPRHTFETWVRDARAVHYQDNVLQVGVVNAYARDWLENRLQSTVERLLVGILNREVTVQFVVAVETEVA